MYVVRKTIRHALYKFTPALAFSISSWHVRRLQKESSSLSRRAARQALFEGETPYVLGGPFAGMRYVDEFTFAPIAPLWLGVYEPQLHPWIRRLIEGGYDSFVDIGAAEGYYAVGVGRACPGMRIVTFDADPFSRRALRRLAALNGVGNLEIRSLCDHRRLEASLGARPFVLCDIEGGELDLIDPRRSPGLARADLVVEIHRAGGHSIGEVRALIADRFRETHKAAVLTDDVEARQRLLEELRTKLSLSKLEALADESRGEPNEWLVLTARVRGGPGQGTGSHLAAADHDEAHRLESPSA